MTTLFASEAADGNQKNAALSLVRNHPKEFWHLSAALKNDPDVAFLAISDPDIQKDKTTVLVALRNHWLTFAKLAKDNPLRADKEVALAAAALNGESALHNCDDTLKDDMDLVLLAMHHGTAYANCSKRLKANKAVLLKALENSTDEHTLKFIQNNIPADLIKAIEDETKIIFTRNWLLRYRTPIMVALRTLAAQDVHHSLKASGTRHHSVSQLTFVNKKTSPRL